VTTRPPLGRSARVVLLVLLGGCLPLPGGHALTRKIVAGKEGEATLVADDGARCRVPPRTFAAVQPGDEHACLWKETDGTVRTPPTPGPRPAPRLPAGALRAPAPDARAPLGVGRRPGG
jgi:hypothetical protein